MSHDCDGRKSHDHEGESMGVARMTTTGCKNQERFQKIVKLMHGCISYALVAWGTKYDSLGC